METKDLVKFVMAFVLIGSLVAISIVFFNTLGDSVKPDTAVSNEAITISSGTVTLAHDELSSITSVRNASGFACNFPDWACANVTLATGVIRFNASFLNGAYNATYNYARDTTGSTVADSMVTAISAIPVTWLPLIVTMVVLIIILGMIINSLGKNHQPR